MPSWSSLCYLTGFALILVGFSRRLRRLALVGIGVLLLTASVRMGTAASGTSMTLTTIDEKPARWLGRLIDEGDLAVLGTRILVLTHQLHDHDAAAVPGALAAAYARMRAEQGDSPSPVLLTWLGFESPGSADVLVFDALEKPRGALIFLHGFSGNFALPCWQIARAAREAGLVTYCPSVGWHGDWWRNQPTLEKALALVRRRSHVDRIYLAGLSNGAAGAARLAPRMRGSFRGMILISGATRNPSPPGVPVLMLQGRHDAVAPLARGYATRTGARYVDLDAGHFAFLLHEKEANRAITSWLEQLESESTSLLGSESARPQMVRHRLGRE